MAVDTHLSKHMVYEIEPAVQDELLRYPGKWVALTRSAVIAVRDTSTEAYDAARSAGIDSPILYQVPDTRTGYSYF
ncbi:MAG: DUF5678 domain-containing protein [Candidatus Limnocylindrales bacterium]